jgi:hypothetical protein
MPDPAAAVVLMLALSTAALALIIIQYRARSVRVSLTTGVLGIVFAGVLLALWPSQSRPLQVPGWATADTALRLEPESSKAEFTPLDLNVVGSDAGGWQIGSVRLHVGNIEPGWYATAQLADGTLRLADGTTLSTAGNGFSSVLTSGSQRDAPARVASRQALGVDRLWEGSPDEELRTVPAIVLSDSQFERHVNSAVDYRGSFLVAVDHVKVAARLPLEAGAEFRLPHYRAVIERVVIQARSVAVQLRQFTAATMFDGGTIPQLTYYLRNSERGEAVAGLAQDAIAMSLGFPFAAGLAVGNAHGNGFQIGRVLVQFPDSYWRGSPGPDLSAGWLARAELVVLQTIPAGEVRKTISIPSMEIVSAASRRSP